MDQFCNCVNIFPLTEKNCKKWALWPETLFWISNYEITGSGYEKLIRKTDFPTQKILNNTLKKWNDYFKDSLKPYLIFRFSCLQLWSF